MNIEEIRELGFENELTGIFEAIPDETILSTKNIADLLGRSEETVRRWCREGKMNAYAFGGKYGIVGEDFKDYIRRTNSKNKRAMRIIN